MCVPSQSLLNARIPKQQQMGVSSATFQHYLPDVGFSSNRTLLHAMSPALREPHSPAAAVMNRQSPRWTGAQTNLTNHLRSIQCQSTRPRKRLRNISCHGDEDPGGLVLPFGKQPFMKFLSEQKPNPSFSTKPFKNVYSNTLCQCLK